MVRVIFHLSSENTYEVQSLAILNLDTSLVCSAFTEGEEVVLNGKSYVVVRKVTEIISNQLDLPVTITFRVAVKPTRRSWNILCHGFWPRKNL